MGVKVRVIRARRHAKLPPIRVPTLVSAGSGTGMAVYPEKLGEANGKRKCGTFLRTLYEGTGVPSDRRSILFFIIEIEN
jgi:hypothetical protein